jgi:stress response protein SCP2
MLANRSFGGAQVSRTFYARGQTGQQLLLGAYSAMMKEVNNKELETIYYGRLKSSKGYSIYHSGDDRIGGLDVDENDNEIITVDFTQLKENVKKIIFTVNSFKRQKFGLIPYIKLRIYEGAPNQPTNTHILTIDIKIKHFIKIIKNLILIIIL